MEIKYECFRKLIWFLEEVPSRQHSARYLWDSSFDQYEKLEIEIENNFIFLSDEQQIKYIAFLMSETQKSIARAYDRTDDIQVFFDRYNTSMDAFINNDTSGDDILNDVFNNEKPGSLVIKYEQISRDQIDFLNMLHLHIGYQRLTWLLNNLKKFSERVSQKQPSLGISKNPSFEKFDDLKEYLKYDSAIARSAIMFYRVTTYQLGLFKQEFFDNVIALDDVPRKMYINKIANELEKDRQYIGQNKIEVEQKCKEYNTTVEKLLDMSMDDNCELFDNLYRDPCYDVATDSFETPQSILNLQNIFYPYFYGEIVRKFFEFIEEQKTSMSSSQPAVATFQPSYSTYERLIDTFDYGKSNDRTPYAFYMLVADRFDGFKQEFHDNMAKLDNYSRHQYLEKLLVELANYEDCIGANKTMVQQRCKEYSIALSDMRKIHALNPPHPLYTILDTPLNYNPLTGELLSPPENRVIQEEFYTYFYGEGIEKILQFLNEQKKELLNTSSEGNQQAKPKTNKKEQSNSSIHETGFGFKGDKSKLLTLLKALQLNLPKGLVNESRCSIENLYIILTASAFTKDSPKIYFSCETIQLAYFLRILKPYFENFDDNQIEAAGLFFTRKPAALTAVNIRKAHSDTPKPKNFAIIDKAVALLNS